MHHLDIAETRRALPRMKRNHLASKQRLPLFERTYLANLNPFPSRSQYAHPFAVLRRAVKP